MKKNCFVLFCWGFFLAVQPVFAEKSLEICCKKVDYAGIIDKISNARGKVVVLNFWAPWCPPCRMEIPDLVKIRNAFSQQEVVMYGVSVDSQIDDLEKFCKTMKINYIILHGQEDVFSGFQIRGIPRTIIYDRNGQKIIDHVGLVGFADLSKEIKKLLKK